MIQRVQSIFLFLAALGFGAMVKLPFASSNVQEAPFFSDQAFTSQDHIILMIIIILGALLSFATIFLFNNRVLQKRLVTVTIILALFTAVVAIWLIYSNASQWSEALVLNDGVGIYVAGGSLLCLVLANYFIGKDEKTVRSMDRLR